MAMVGVLAVVWVTAIGRKGRWSAAANAKGAEVAAVNDGVADARR